jgi:hypothetical protein
MPQLHTAALEALPWRLGRAAWLRLVAELLPMVAWMQRPEQQCEAQAKAYQAVTMKTSRCQEQRACRYYHNSSCGVEGKALDSPSA